VVLDSVKGQGAGAALEEADFRLTAPSGLGNGWNHYAHSMAWFEGRLYVGTTMATMAFLKRNQPVPDLKPWPVDVPANIDSIDRRAEIWQYTPQTGTWRRVFLAPWTQGRDGRTVPLYVSYRGMTVFQGLTDPKPCLYVTTWVPQVVGPAQILRSEDGERFEAIPHPPWGASARAARTLQVFQGRVHTTAVASGTEVGKSQDSVSDDPTIYASDDPRRGAWVPVGATGFGDPHNLTVFDMAEYHGHLYAGTINARHGFEVWKTAGGEPPYRWTKVLEHGAWRGPLNEAAGTFAEFRGALYVGTGVANGGFHRAFKLGPAAPELLRLWPDDSWDLIVGESRATPQGLKYPLSGFAPGFDTLFNGYMWRACVHDDHLYVSTFTWAQSLPYLPAHLWSENMVALVKRWGMETLAYRYGGFDLWRTADGVHWHPVTRNGFGNPYNWGGRTLVSTPYGLFVGTANPYGPSVALRRNGRWVYEPNPRGGCEVWLGSKQATAACPAQG
jgi:hypothetical protein